MKSLLAGAATALAALVFLAGAAPAQGAAPADSIPLPEHPRPDWERAQWRNLNGTWKFQLDPKDLGLQEGWFRSGLPSPQSIVVPFSWAAPLSGVRDSADIGWYQRTISVPADWSGERVFLVVGASDWKTTAWLDGHELGTHEGGYTPFEWEVTPYLRAGGEHRLVIRVDDATRDFTLQGKQGYGNVRGIWQTIYLDARGSAPLASVHFSPDIDHDRVHVEARLLEPAPRDLSLTLRFRNGDVQPVTRRIARGARQVGFDVPIPDEHLWSLDDPYLYQVTARVAGNGLTPDSVDTYFGMRKISVVNLPGTDYRYVALNNEPLYLELTLDQAYNPEGFYTYPSDRFIRDEVLRVRRIGLTGLRNHIKVTIPRKLYWADRLGVLVMADLPNFWGEPTPRARQESESTLRAMIERDYNHPAVFSWITFNETWGLKTKQGGKDVYLPETQKWVASVYHLARSLDPTRLVEDNSVCCEFGHTETDINSWHDYLPGWEWGQHLTMVSDSTYPGSPWNFEPGYRQGDQPNINSEFGNVWGYEGSTGDVDYSWDYHRAVNAFRRHPKIAGWLYTELTDVINEWNGYWRYDRSDKTTGLGELVDGMSLRDLHSPLYVVVGDSLSRTVRPGERLQVPLYASFLSGSEAYGDSLVLKSELYGWNSLGEKQTYSTGSRAIPYHPWMTGDLAPLAVTMPDGPAVAVLATRLENAAGTVLQRNFTTFVVQGPAPTEATLANGKRARLVRIDPKSFDSAQWSLKQWNVLDGLKVDGAGSGFFEYRVPWPAGVKPGDLESVSLVMEASAKQLFGKDRPGSSQIEGDYMRGRGTLDPSRNPNAYPMTDETKFPSAVTIRVNGVEAGRQPLADDPADHRGILSWASQPHDRHLYEAGSYGELVHVAIPREALRRAAEAGQLVIRLEVSDALPGGLAIYGAHFGRYPLDPTLVFVPK
ncbi:MAG TPA: glycoside hydrolase family 2 TIM barrel-domain containing protein [Longimicrobiaceae bacterium]|nr:glycoside hydrolase family 2 TIM barrel-domain containing protein [Longimicrobiaceae bacterium]